MSLIKRSFDFFYLFFLILIKCIRSIHLCYWILSAFTINSSSKISSTVFYRIYIYQWNVPFQKCNIITLKICFYQLCTLTTMWTAVLSCWNISYSPEIRVVCVPICAQINSKYFLLFSLPWINFVFVPPWKPISVHIVTTTAQNFCFLSHIMITIISLVRAFQIKFLSISKRHFSAFLFPVHVFFRKLQFCLLMCLC